MAGRPLVFAQHFIVCITCLGQWKLSGCTFIVAIERARDFYVCVPLSSHRSGLLCDNHRKTVFSSEALRKDGWGQSPRGLPLLEPPQHIRETPENVPAIPCQWPVGNKAFRQGKRSLHKGPGAAQSGSNLLVPGSQQSQTESKAPRHAP